VQEKNQHTVQGKSKKTHSLSRGNTRFCVFILFGIAGHNEILVKGLSAFTSFLSTSKNSSFTKAVTMGHIIYE